MEFETRQRVTPNINLSALMDVAFILVIFIVLISEMSLFTNVYERSLYLSSRLPEFRYPVASRQRFLS